MGNLSAADRLLDELAAFERPRFGPPANRARELVEAFQRKLLPGEVVHHKNLNHRDNRLWNLQILPSHAAHMALHAAARRMKEKLAFQRFLEQLRHPPATDIDWAGLHNIDLSEIAA